MKKIWRQLEWRVSLLYLLFGLLWIIASDELLKWLVPSMDLQMDIQTYKGWFFVSASALLIFFTLRGAIERQREAEKKEVEYQSRFQKLYETSLDGILLTAPTGEIFAANPAACKILERTEEEVISIGRHGIVDPADPRLEPALKERERTGSFSGEMTLVRGDGSKFEAELSSVIFTDTLGEIRTNMVIRDLTEKKLLNTQLQRVRERLNQTLESMTDAFILLDSDWHVIYMNDRAIKRQEKTYDQIAGKSHWEIWPMTIGTEVEAYYRSAAADGKPVHFEHHYYEKGKYDEWHDIHVYPSEEGLAIYYSDTTSRKKTEEALQSYNERLEKEVEDRTRELKQAQELVLKQERLANLGQLAGGMAHELRNPLGVISNAVYYLRMILPEADEKVREYLGILEKESQAAVQIMSDLLNFSTIQTGDRYPVEVKQIIESVLSQFPPYENIEAKLVFAKECPEIFVDSHQVEMALGRLVVNAYQAMEKGGKLSITVYPPSGSDREYVSILIEDNGTGISTEHLDKVFEPLFTTKPRHLGLGLPISKRLIEVNGGRIRLTSKEGKGTRIEVHLPIK